jgi:hypothetical protein
VPVAHRAAGRVISKLRTKVDSASAEHQLLLFYWLRSEALKESGAGEIPNLVGDLAPPPDVVPVAEVAVAAGAAAAGAAAGAAGAAAAVAVFDIDASDVSGSDSDEERSKHSSLDSGIISDSDSDSAASV